MYSQTHIRSHVHMYSQKYIRLQVHMYICTEPTHHVVGDSHQHNSAASPHRLHLNTQVKRGWLQTPKTEGQLRIPQKFGFMPQLGTKQAFNIHKYQFQVMVSFNPNIF